VIGAVLGVLPEDEEWMAGLPWGDEATEGAEDFAASLEDGIVWAQGSWMHGDEPDPEPVGGAA
jgi:hypothetical protein